MNTQTKKLLEELKGKIEGLKEEMINVWTNKDFNSVLLQLTSHDEMCMNGCDCKEIIENRFKEISRIFDDAMKGEE